MSGCDQETITNDALRHLTNLQTLYMVPCDVDKFAVFDFENVRIRRIHITFCLIQKRRRWVSLVKLYRASVIVCNIILKSRSPIQPEKLFSRDEIKSSAMTKLYNTHAQC